MTAPITFYPAFSSSYSYFAAQLIDEVAEKHGRPVLWRPIRLARGHDHHYPGGRPARLGARFDYMTKDAERIAELRGLPYAWPPEFPPDSDMTPSVCYALAEGDETRLRGVTLAMMGAVWGRGQTMRTVEEIVAGLSGFGASRTAVAAAANDPAGAAAHDEAVNAALASGIFGAPWIVVEGQTFWGHDRLDYLDRWLAREAGRG